MVKCKNEIAEGIRCPNEEWQNGLCALHSDIDWNERNTSEIIEVISNNFYSILSLEPTKFVFRKIVFPSKFSFKPDIEVSKEISFIDSRFTGLINIDRLKTNRPLSFKNCEFLNIMICEFEPESDLLFSDCNIGLVFEISYLTMGKFFLKVINTNAKKFIIKNSQFNGGLTIRTKEESLCENVELENVDFNAITLICIDIQSGSWTNMKGCGFNSLTVLDLRRKGEIGSVNLMNCVFDGLYVKNFVAYESYEKKQSKRIDITQPLRKKGLREIINNFSNIYEYDILENYLDFARLMKNRYKDSEKREIYDMYYVLDHYYSANLPSYGKLNWFINRCSYIFSLYGYSIWRPVGWLLATLFLFNCIYFLFELPALSGASIWVYLGNFGETFGHHLEKISFFRTPNEWLSTCLGKRIIFIFEGLVLIPIIASIILGIRKLFKRV